MDLASGMIVRDTHMQRAWGTIQRFSHVDAPRAGMVGGGYDAPAYGAFVCGGIEAPQPPRSAPLGVVNVPWARVRVVNSQWVRPRGNSGLHADLHCEA